MNAYNWQCDGLKWCTNNYFCFLNTFKFYKVLQVLASFLFVVVYVNIKELKIGCLVKIERLQALTSMTHSMVDSKRCEKTCD